jgi:hypothetical protein
MSLRVFQGLDWISEQNSRRKSSARSSECKVEFRFQMISLEFNRFSDASQIASRLAFSVRDFVVVDNVETSTWQKFLCYSLPGPADPPRENGSQMLVFEYALVRPDVERVDNKEARLKVYIVIL